MPLSDEQRSALLAKDGANVLFSKEDKKIYMSHKTKIVDPNMPSEEKHEGLAALVEWKKAFPGEKPVWERL